MSEGPYFNPLNAKLNPIRHLLALVGAHHSVHVSRIRVNYEAQSALFKGPVRTAQ
jgi:hypothetical protein